MHATTTRARIARTFTPGPWYEHKNYFAEIFVGLENILKIFRVDYVIGYSNSNHISGEVRIGTGGILGGSVRAPGQPKEW